MYYMYMTEKGEVKKLGNKRLFELVAHCEQLKMEVVDDKQYSDILLLFKNQNEVAAITKNAENKYKRMVESIYDDLIFLPNLLYNNRFFLAIVKKNGKEIIVDRNYRLFMTTSKIDIKLKREDIDIISEVDISELFSLQRKILIKSLEK